MLITNIRLFDGTTDKLIEESSILVEGNIIRYAGPSKKLKDVPEGIQTIDGNGLFVMPGMVEAHAHVSYSNSGPLELDKAPVEESMIKTIANARMMLGSGFTSAISFGSVHKIDVFLKEAIEKGEIPNLDDIFHADYLYLKDNTLVNRDEHLEFMRKEFTRKITVINPQFLYEDKDMMTYSYNIKVREKSYRVIQVQMWKDGKIWREMSNAVEN